jgi:LPXTG-motif cell wall-anchored protein
VQPNSSVQVTITGLADGVRTISVTAGQLDLSQTVTINCVHPTSMATVCAEVDAEGARILWTYTITNNDTVSTTYTLTQGASSTTVTLAAGASSTQTTSSSTAVVASVGSQTVANLTLDTTEVCTENVEFKKVITGPAPSPAETYTIVVTRGGVTVLQFTINAGETKSFSLPAGIDDGIVYTVTETVKGTALTTQISPNSFSLVEGGSTVSVTVTNGYAQTGDGGSTTTTPTTVAPTTTNVQSEPPVPTTTTPAPTTTVNRVLPRTGGSPSNTLGVAVSMMMAGIAFLIGSRRTRQA